MFSSFGITARTLGRNTHWRSGDMWSLVRVSRAAFHKFAESLCSSRYVWKVMRKLVHLGYVRVFTLKGQKGYGLVVDAIKRHKVSGAVTKSS